MLFSCGCRGTAALVDIKPDIKIPVKAEAKATGQAGLNNTITKQTTKTTETTTVGRDINNDSAVVKTMLKQNTILSKEILQTQKEAADKMVDFMWKIIGGLIALLAKEMWQNNKNSKNTLDRLLAARDKDDEREDQFKDELLRISRDRELRTQKEA